MTEAVAEAAIVIDASQAQSAASSFEAAGKRIIGTNNDMAAATQRTTDSNKVLDRQLATLTRTIDPAGAALAKYERGQALLSAAHERGKLDAQQYGQMLDLLGKKYLDAAQGANALMVASRDLAQAQAAYAAQLQSMGAEVDRLRASYVPLAAAQQAFRQQMTEINELQRAGIITEREATAAREESMSVMRQQIATVTTYSKESLAAQQNLKEFAQAAKDSAQAQVAYGNQLQQVADEVDRLRARYVPLAGAQQQFQRQIEEINDAQKLGVLSDKEATAARTTATASYQTQVNALGKYGQAQAGAANAIGLTRREMQLLSPQIADVGVSLAGGLSPLTVLIQQGPQITDALGGVSRTLGLLRTAAMAFAPVFLAVAVPAALIASYNTLEGRLSDLRATLRGVTDDYQKAAVDVNAAANRLTEAGLGISRADATSSIASFARAAPEGSNFDFEALTRDAADFARVMGTDVPTAAARLAQGMRDPAALVKELGEKNFPGMSASLQRTVEVMFNGGQRADAFELVMGRLRGTITGMAADVPPAEKAMRDLSSSWHSFTDSVMPWLATGGKALLDFLTSMTNLLTGAVGALLRLPAGISALAQAATRSGTTFGDPQTDAFVAQLANRESGNRPGVVNQFGYSGLYQFGTAALQSLGVYAPAPGESTRTNQWQGTFQNIPGFPNVTTRGEENSTDPNTFLGNAAAQNAVMALRLRQLQDIVDTALQGIPDAQRAQLNLAGLLGVAHTWSSPDAVRQFVLGTGTDRTDGNGQSAQAIYNRYATTANPAVTSAAPGTPGNPIALPPLSVPGETNPDELLRQRALRIANGTEGRVGSLLTNQSNRAQIASNQNVLGQALALPGNTQANTEAFTRAMEQQRVAYEGTLTAAEKTSRAQQEQIAILGHLDPIQRSVAEAVQQYRDAERDAGRIPSPAGEAQAQSDALARLQAEYRGVTNQARLQADSSQRVADAYGQSTEAGKAQELRERAIIEVRKSGITGANQQATAIALLTVQYQRNATAEALKQLSQQNNQSQANLDYMAKETELIGQSAEARERELAIFRLRQQAQQNGISLDSVEEQQAERLAARTAALRASNEQLTNSWTELTNFADQTFDKIGSSITDAFAQGKISAVDFKNVAKAALSEVIQAVLKLAVINPILNAVFGGTRGTAGGILSVLGGGNSLGTSSAGLGLGSLGISGAQLVVNPNTGNVQVASNQALQTASLTSAGKFGNLGSAFTGQGLANTGWGFADNILNTPLIGTGSLATTGSTFTGVYNGVATTAPVYGIGLVDGVNTAAPLVNAGGVNGLTVAGGLGAGASILGGAYGIYSGLQKGGIGGGVGVLGGAAGVLGGAATIGGAALAGSAGTLGAVAGGLSAFGPVGMIAAAVLAIASALLPGQKPSGKGQEFRVDLMSGATDANGLGGDRYSASNASQAEQAARGIADLSAQLSQQLGGAVIPGEAAVGVTSGRGDGDNGKLYLEVSGQKAQFDNSADGAQQLADQATKFLLTAFRDHVSGDFAGILAASPDIDTLNKNLDWYNNVYKSFETTTDDAAKKTSAYQQALDQVTASYADNIAKAQELSLSTDAMTAARQKELDAVTAQRDLQVKDFDLSLTYRDLAATGGDSSDVAMQLQLMQFDQNATDQLAQAKTQLEDWGLSADDVASRLATNEKVLGEERLKIQNDYNDQIAQQAAEAQQQMMDQATQSATSVISSLLDYTRGLAFSDNSALSPQDQYAAALADYNSVAQGALGGDAASLGRLQGSSDTLLTTGRSMFGSGSQYADLYNRVTTTLGQVGNVSADTLTASFYAQVQQTQTQTLVVELQALRAEVTSLRIAQTQNDNAPARSG